MTKILWWILSVALLLGIIAPAYAQSSQTCLVVRNNRSNVTTVTVRGYDEDNWRWIFQPGEYTYLTYGKIAGSPLVRSGKDGFTIHLYDGSGIDNSRSMPGDNRYVTWTYRADLTHDGACSDGSWLATLHD